MADNPITNIPIDIKIDEIKTRKQFIEKLKPEAVKIKNVSGIQPIILITQALHESSKFDNSGNWIGVSRLVEEANNLFGIKATDSWIWKGLPTWTGKTQEELDKNKPIWDRGLFRKYGTYYECCIDFASIVSTLQRYKKAYEYAKSGAIESYGLEMTSKRDISGKITEFRWATDWDYKDCLVRVSKIVKPILESLV